MTTARAIPPAMRYCGKVDATSLSEEARVVGDDEDDEEEDVVFVKVAEEASRLQSLKDKKDGEK